MTSCDYHRIILPMTEMGIQVDGRGHSGSVYLLNRVGFVPHGRPFILDLDDYWELDDSNPFKGTWDARGIKGAILHNVQNALAVLVTNQQLADKVLPMNPNVHIVPNALPFDRGQFTRTEPDFDRYVYAGGLSHARDIELLDGIVHAQVEYFGGLKGSPAMHVESYMDVYNGKGVSLVPLHDSEFNRCKSNLKVLEAGAKGLACMASDVLPYANYLDRDFLFLTSDFGWDLESLPKDELEDSAKALADHVREHYHLDNVNRERKQILEYYCNKI